MPAVRRLSATAAVAVAGALLLAGCTPANAPVTDYRGEPRGVPAPASSAGGAPFGVWLKGGSRFSVTLYGTASCPPVPTGYRTTGSNAILLDVPVVTNRPCGKGYIPHTSVFSTPPSIDRHKNLTITAQAVRFTLLGMPR